MGHLLEKAASPKIVNAAWRKYRNDKAIWEPGLPGRVMKQNIAYHLLDLAQQLRTAVYTPDPVRFFTVEKGNGKQRVISAYTLRDKVAQRAVLNVIEPLGEKYFHHDSYGYRPGRSIDMILARVRQYMLCGMEWVVDADIQGFFDHIPHQTLVKRLRSVIPDRELTALMTRWFDVGAMRRGIFASARGIPQGAVLSPFLCNIYLTAWDNAMARKNLPFVRFADDFLVLAKTESEAHKAHAYISKVLAKLKLELNPKKTRVARCGPRVKFLGRKLPQLKKK